MKRETLTNKVKRFNEAIDHKIPGKITGIKRAFLFLDFFREYQFHGAYLQDYIQYEFYNKKRRERENYVVHGKLLEMMHRCNNPEHRPFFDNKPMFDEKFSEFLRRDWIDTEKATEEEFVKFLDGKKDFFAKQPDGMFGLGVQKIAVSEIENVGDMFREFKSKKMLCEETLTQCKEFEEFNDTSINTLRVVSMIAPDGDVKIMGALLRLGRKGKIADNFHHQGIAAFIDPIHGIVCTPGIDKNDARHIVHPDSQKKIVGFQVPCWDSVTETVKKAAKIFPDMRYIGWDVVITSDYQIALVEGNPGADPDAEQITTREGRWPYYLKYMGK